jgi:hypothetical protein
MRNQQAAAELADPATVQPPWDVAISFYEQGQRQKKKIL